MGVLVYAVRNGRVVKIDERQKIESAKWGLSKRRDVIISVPAPASAGAKAPKPGG